MNISVKSRRVRWKVNSQSIHITLILFRFSIRHNDNYRVSSLPIITCDVNFTRPLFMLTTSFPLLSDAKPKHHSSVRTTKPNWRRLKSNSNLDEILEFAICGCCSVFISWLVSHVRFIRCINLWLVHALSSLGAFVGIGLKVIHSPTIRQFGRSDRGEQRRMRLFNFDKRSPSGVRHVLCE